CLNYSRHVPSTTVLAYIDLPSSSQVAVNAHRCFPSKVSAGDASRGPTPGLSPAKASPDMSGNRLISD
ncbi:MAG: hypothetical protein QF419_06060, partial [Acidimicrobiales bacterium]|nr:hypothetical protein [Acidimicrobiales bacterium]